LEHLTTWWLNDGVLLKQDFTPRSYCDEKFPAIRPSTLYSAQPALKDSSSGDMIDFYGPCDDENSLGKDQAQEQRLQSRTLAHDYDGLDPSIESYL